MYNRLMNLILLGPPGSGKGTQAKLLADHFSLSHISSGQLLRQAAKENPAIQAILDSGELVPFETVLSVIKPKLVDGFILDGTPRNLDQAEKLDQFFKDQHIDLDRVIYYDLPDEEGIKRLLSRAQKEHRSDDTPAVIQDRYEVYHQETQPLIDYYSQKNLLLTIDARPEVDTIFKNTLSEL